jgi:hypothetical protein
MALYVQVPSIVLYGLHKLRTCSEVGALYVLACERKARRKFLAYEVDLVLASFSRILSLRYIVSKHWEARMCVHDIPPGAFGGL